MSVPPLPEEPAQGVRVKLQDVLNILRRDIGREHLVEGDFPVHKTFRAAQQVMDKSTGGGYAFKSLRISGRVWEEATPIIFVPSRYTLYSLIFSGM